MGQTFFDDLKGAAAGAGEAMAMRALRAMSRVDSWVNVATAFGTASDKTIHNRPQHGYRLTAPELTALYNEDDLAAKIVDVYPREALRVSFKVGGIDNPETLNLRVPLAGSEDPETHITDIVEDAWIWARLYGGAAIWPIVDGIEDQITPQTSIPRVVSLRVVDRRYLRVASQYMTGPKAGFAETYWITDLEGSRLIRVHETRLIMFPGARTDRETRNRDDRFWLSVLQRPYEALRSNNNVWKGIEIQVTDGNQGVFKIKNLFAMLAGKQGELLLDRIRLMDQTRSVARAVALDAEYEDFSQLSAKLEGLTPLAEHGLKRVAAAAEIPVTILLGESPAGLNATGKEDVKGFYGKVEAERKRIAEPRIVRLIRLLNPGLKPDAKLTLEWEPLSRPTALEQVDMNLKQAQADAFYIVNEVATQAEIGLSRFTEEGWSPFTKIDRDLREKMQKLDADALLNPEPEPEPEPESEPEPGEQEPE